MILILATGRCGSSETARILHEELDINMGHAFHMGDRFNIKGYYEDREFQARNLSFYMMHLDEINDKIPWKLWRDEFNKLLDKRKEPWGLKDCGIADFPKLLNEYLKLNPRIIYCTRDKEETIKSLMRFKDKPRKEMQRIYENRTKNIENVLKNKDYLEVKCNQPYEDKEIIIREWYKKQL